MNFESGSSPLGTLGTKFACESHARFRRREMARRLESGLAAALLARADSPLEGRELRTADESRDCGGALFTTDGHWLFERSYNDPRRYDGQRSAHPTGKWACDTVTAFSPDTKMMLIQTGNELRLLDTESGQITGEAILAQQARASRVRNFRRTAQRSRRALRMAG